VILGSTGRNFAAGMSGGIAYIWDPNNEFAPKCNMEMVELEEVVDPDDVAELKGLISEHLEVTDSTVAKLVLENWDKLLREFVKVMPTDYKRVLQEKKKSSKELVA